jgi:hypothetical protein
MRKYAVALTFLLVVSGCGGSSDTATPATTVAPLVTQAPTTTVVPTTTATPTTQAPATTVAGSAELAAVCTFDESVPKISCHAVGFAQSDQLRWESNVYGHSQGTSYEVELVEQYQLVPEVTVTLQECQGSDCESVTTTIDTSAIAQDLPDSSASTMAPTTTVVSDDTVTGPAELAAVCTFDESVPKISCHAVGFLQGSQLRWESNVYGWQTGTSYEVVLVEQYQLVAEAIVTLQECQGSDCELVTTTIDTSAIAQSPSATDGGSDQGGAVADGTPTTAVAPDDTGADQTELAAVCTFDESVPRISCQAIGATQGSQLRWESNVYGWQTGTSYEVELVEQYQLVSEVAVTLQECQGSACKTVYSTIDTSAIAQTPDEATSSSSGNVSEQQHIPAAEVGCVERDDLSFSHHAVDLDAISGISPNMVVSGNWLKPNNYVFLSQDTSLFTPADATSVGLLTWQMTYSDDSGAPQTKVQYSVQLQLSCSVSFRFEHVEELAEPFASLTTPVEETEANLDNRQSTKLGNWLFYEMGVPAGTIVGFARVANLSGAADEVDLVVKNADRVNQFANQDRYLVQGDLGNLLHTDCPFDFYPSDMRSQWLGLFGIDGVSTANYDCDLTPDVRGTIAGGWFQSPHDPNNAKTLIDWGMAVRINSNGELDVGHPEGIVRVDPTDPTFRDPKSVSDAHCFHDTEKDLFGYLEPIGDLEMRAAFGSGSCPAEMPSNTQTFYR